MSQNVGAFGEEMMNNIGNMPKRFKFSMAKGVMGDIVGEY
jgi:hypothetical protein